MWLSKTNIAESITADLAAEKFTTIVEDLKG
jgi:hypothetical protein